MWEDTIGYCRFELHFTGLGGAISDNGPQLLCREHLMPGSEIYIYTYTSHHGILRDKCSSIDAFTTKIFPRQS